MRAYRGAPRSARSWALRLRRHPGACGPVVIDEVADTDAAGGAARVEQLLRRLDGCPMVIAHGLVQEQRRLRP